VSFTAAELLQHFKRYCDYRDLNCMYYRAKCNCK